MLNDREESKSFINLGVVLNDKGEVLVIRRKIIERGTDGSVLQWAFPGGKQRYSETREECVRREVLDETGYDIVPQKQISLRVHPQFPVVVVYHLCVLSAPKPIAQPKEPHEIAEIKWVKPKELLSLFTSDFDPKVKQELGLR